MNQTELEAKLIEWRDKKKELDELEQTIKAAVMEGEKTVGFKNVRASYSGGRKTYDYKTAVEKGVQSGHITLDILNEYTQSKVDWAKICDAMFAKSDIPFDKSKPSVSLKFK